MNTLITIPFSHYCEKARWALERGGIDYRERRYMPMFHFVPAIFALGRRGGERDRYSTPFATPIFTTQHGPISGSTAVMRHADRRLFEIPDVERQDVEALVDHFDRALGPHTRRVFYWHALPDRRFVFQIAKANVSPPQYGLYRLAHPAVAKALTRALQIGQEEYEASLGAVERVADEVAERLADGRPYLFGNHFSAADLTFAALFAPMVLPEGYGATIPESTPTPLQQLIDRFRQTPAGRFTTRLYAERESWGQVH